MNLPYALSTAAALPLMGTANPENVTHIDELLTRAGAAMYEVGNRLEDLATSLALGHLCDISEGSETIAECLETLANGGDVERYDAALKEDLVDEDHLAYRLSKNFGPISALDGSDTDQAALARTVSVRLRAAYRLASHVEKLRYNNPDLASNLLFSATQMCRLSDQELQEIDAQSIAA